MAKLYFRYIPESQTECKNYWHYTDDNGNERYGVKETDKNGGIYACEYAALSCALEDVRELLDGSQLVLHTCMRDVELLLDKIIYGKKVCGVAKNYTFAFEDLLRGIDFSCEFVGGAEMSQILRIQETEKKENAKKKKQVFKCYGTKISLDEQEFADDGNHYVAYTDGSGDYRNGFGGAAYVILKDGQMLAERSKGNRNTTNNRQEIMAIVSALNFVPVGSSIDIYTDSQYAIYFFTQKLSLKAKNLDLKKQLPKYTSGKKIRFHWVKGHNGNHWNERADYLANKAFKDICSAYGVQ